MSAVAAFAPSPGRTYGTGLLMGVLLLGGCSLVPDYQRPALPVQTHYPEGVSYPDAQERATLKARAPTADTGWREFFVSDPVLRQLVELALENNRDLRVSTLNVIAARATYREQRGDLFPTLDGTAGFTMSRAPADIYGAGNPATLGVAGLNSGGGGLSTAGTTLKEWSLGLGVSSYEVDLFGRVRALTSEAFQTALADEETRRSSQISLISEVADAYLTLIADRQALKVTEATLASQRHTYDLDVLTLRKGEGTAQSVVEQESSVRTAESSLAQYHRQVAQDENALRLLLGASPSPELQAELDEQVTLDGREPFPQVSAGLPSDLILRRPDIRAAEHTLLAANADVGSARANFFPTITLTASGGTASNELSNLFRAGQSNWSFSPSLSVPIFDAGVNAAKLDYSRTQKRIQIANYEKAIQTGFREVADALVSQDTYRDELEANRRLVAADQRDYDLSMMRFQAGIDTYTSALVAQRALFSAQLTLVSIRSSQLQSQVTLYEALGGGWQHESPELIVGK